MLHLFRKPTKKCVKQKKSQFDNHKYKQAVDCMIWSVIAAVCEEIVWPRGG